MKSTRKPGRPKRRKNARTKITVDLGCADSDGNTYPMYWRSELEREFGVGRSTFTRWLSNLISYSQEFQSKWIPYSERFSELHRYYFLRYQELRNEYSGIQLKQEISRIPKFQEDYD